MDSLPRRAFMRCARAALRETWEEAGVFFGRHGGGNAGGFVRRRSPVAEAYAEAGVVAGFDRLTYLGRAITPARVFRRFNTRFFLGDGRDVVGAPQSTDELEDVRWHPIGRETLEPLRDVSQFMLARAIALRAGDAAPPPLFYTVAGKRRIGVCREAVLGRSTMIPGAPASGRRLDGGRTMPGQDILIVVDNEASVARRVGAGRGFGAAASRGG